MRDAEGRPVESIASLAGLSQTRPMLAAAMAIFMFSLAGIPPFLGFFPKFFVFDAAVAAIGLPSSATTCTAPVDFVVPIVGPNDKGEFLSGKINLQAHASTTKGAEDDKYQLVCRPGSVPAVTTTTIPTTSTTLPGPTPGAGLDAAVVAASISSAGQIVVTFHLSDAAGTPITSSALT